MDINEDIISRFENAGSLEGMTNELFTSDNIYMNGEQEDDSEPDDIIILHMDIREPLRTLKTLLEQKIGVDLKKYTFWLQDAQILEPHKNLVDQCVKGEGLVQINVQIQTIQQRINIVDVLKPTDAALAAIEATVRNGQTITNCEKLTNEINVSQLNYDSNGSDGENTENTEINNSNNTQSSHDKDAPCLNWVLDSKFKKEQARLEIPEDPNDWSIAQVKHWFRWAVRQFNLSQISLSAWNITGAELCALTHKEFRQKVPKDPGNVFWTHLQLLKECKFVSVIHKLPEVEENGDGNVNIKKELKIMRKSAPFFNGKNFGSSMTTRSTSSPPTLNSGGNNNTGGIGGSGGGSGGGNSSLGNNGQVQLWQFLLEILTDREHKNIIQWVGADGEFKLTDPEKVARLWGEKKNKPAMNYEKLSRALRYYYDGDMISKVSGKRFAYKFDCDLKLLIGYNAEEISKLVNEKNFVDESIYMDHNGATSDDE